MRIGVFGGTFDPPHIGHLILAGEAQDQCQLANILWVLTPYPPHKDQQQISSIEDRLKMVELVVSGDSNFILSYVDVNRKPPHYAVDTMKIIKAESPNNEYFYIMGADSLNDLMTWHKPSEFIELCDGIIVMHRNGEVISIQKYEADFPAISEKLFILKTPVIEISSTDIRSRVNAGSQYRYFLPENIHQYIVEHQLYSDQPSN